MSTYESVPTTIEAMQWHPDCGLQTQEGCARIIVAWVNDNGGEANYFPKGGNGPIIQVRTKDGWADAVPGWYVVMGEAWFDSDTYFKDGDSALCHDFHVVRELADLRLPMEWRLKNA